MPVGGLEALRDNLKTPLDLINTGKNIKIFIDVLINGQGNISEIKLDDPNINSDVKKAAFDAIKSVKWEPAKYQNKTVKAWVKVPIEFRITG